MKHPYFNKAVIEAYQNILPAESVPSYFIFMETDPASIDINIHPTKTEIKFEDERSIWQILMASVREALGRFNIGPSLDFENEALIDIPVRSSSDKTAAFPSIEINPQYDPFADDDGAANQDKIIERFERENINSWEKLFSSRDRESTEPQAVEPERKFFQIKSKYIVCPVKSGLMLIDQKRAHERILFERFLKNLGENRAFSQSDMFPVNIELNPADVFVLKEIEDYIRLLGFSIKYSGRNTISITGRPSGSGSSDPAELIEILLEEYKRTQSEPSTGVKEKVAAAMAGASAIPYGKILQKNEMEDIFDALFACKSPNYSPKGKPVINILTLEEIDKRFK
jgi:DNA mismatch repair protein MutL